MKRRRKTKTVLERFTQQYIPEPNSGCWLWQGAFSRMGYGAFSVDSVPKRANRVSYELFKGPIPPGLFVLHRCDTPACVNPDHLYAGTDKDNVRDMVARNRMNFSNQIRGERHHQSKLNAATVRMLRESNHYRHRARDLAKEYGVSKTAINRALKGLSWTHV